MMVAAKPYSRADRARIRVLVAGIAITLSALVMILLAVIATAPESQLNADRERTLQRQATVITENLAASLILTQASVVGSQQMDGLIEPSASELAAALKTYDQLSSIVVLSEDWRVIAAAGIDLPGRALQIEALRALSEDRFPPGGDDITMVRLQGQILTAGRILEGAGRGGPLLVLGFSSTPGAEVTRVLLYAWGGLTLFGLLIWGTLDQMLRHLILAPLLRIRRHQNIARLGDWTQRIQSEGVLDIQRYASLYNRALDRAARLWSTISWRRQHLGSHAPEKAAEADRATSLLEGHYRFVPNRGSSDTTPPYPSFVPIAILALSEFAALLASLCAQGVDARSLDTGFSWHMTAVLSCTGLGLVIGCRVIPRPDSHAEYQIRLVALSLLLAAAHLSGAWLIPNTAAVAIPRIVSGICVAAALNLWMHRVMTTSRPPPSRSRIALVRTLFVAVFAALSPCVIYAVVSSSQIEILAVTSGTGLVIACVAGWSSLTRRERPPIENVEGTGSPQTFGLLKLAYAVSATTITLSCLISILTIDVDDSGRYIRLVMFFIALCAGIGLPFSLSARGVLLALLVGATCAAPGLYVHYLMDAANTNLLQITVNPAIGLIAGSSVAFTALTVPERAVSTRAGVGQARPVYARLRTVIQCVGLGFIVATPAHLYNGMAIGDLAVFALILVSCIALASSRLRVQSWVDR